MCVGDWRLGRLIRTQITNWTMPGSSGLVVPASMQRVAVNVALVGLTIASTQYVTLTIDGKLTFQLDNVVHFIHYAITEHGDLPTKSMTLTNGSGAMTGSIIEYFLPEEVLAAGSEEFRRDLSQWLR